MNKQILGTKRWEQEKFSTDVSDLIAEAEAYSPSKTKPIPPLVIPTGESKIRSLDYYWRIDNVNVNGVIKPYNLKKTLLKEKTFAKHLEYARQIGESDFHIDDLIVYHAIFTSLYNSWDKPEIEEIKNFLKKSMRDNWLLTGTGVDYYANSKQGKVLHNLGNLEHELKIIGPDEYVKDSDDKDFYKALTGDDSPTQINDVYNWITDKDLYSWRLNSENSNLRKRAVRLDSDSDRVSFYAYGDLSNLDRCFGVSVAD